jgi:phosphoribosyl 1,2-cyclic phosphodiesterase
VALSFTILGSGSAGNCAYIETDQTRLLIDAGFSARQTRQRLASIGRSPETLTATLVTHEHVDHIHGLEMLCGQSGLPIYCNRLTQEAIAEHAQVSLPFRIFATGSSFEVGDVLVDAFSIPHDAQDPVGFMIHAADGNIGFLTDLGHATRLVLERVRCANALVLEANHDVQMLQEDRKRPWSVKQRILSRHGHLSNENAADALEEIVSENLRHLYLGHLSRDCNRPELALEVVRERRDRLGAAHIAIQVTSQDRPSPTLTLTRDPSPRVRGTPCGVPPAAVPQA